jgi:hypothetical protein
MADWRFDKLPFKTLDEWEALQKDVRDEGLRAIQKSLSKELRRRNAEKKAKENLEKMAAKYGYKLEPLKEEERKAEEVTKPSEAKPAIATPFKM